MSAIAMMAYLFLVAASAATASSSFVLPAPDYLGYVRTMLPELDKSFTASTCASLERRGSLCSTATDVAQAHAAFYDATSDGASLARVNELLLAYVGSWRNVTANNTKRNPSVDDFFACKPLATAAGTLLRAAAPGAPENWTVADLADLETAASQVCSPCCQVGTFNQPLSRAAGVARFLRAFPGGDPDGSRAAYLTATWDYWSRGVNAHTYTENANVYNSIFVSELFSLGSSLNASALAADLATAETRSMLRLFRDTVGPSGLAPAYGDDWSLVGGSGAGTDTTVWAPEETCYWPSVFERAAAAYANESSQFAWAAASYFHAATNGYQLDPPLGPAPPPYSGGPGKCLLHYIEAATVRPQNAPPPAYFGDAPGATVRLTPGTASAVSSPDKLILYSSRAPCVAPSSSAPYAMFDVFSAGKDHAHLEQTGALIYFASRGVTYVHGAGRDNQLAAAAATLILAPDASSNASHFPFSEVTDQFVAGGAWTLVEMSTRHLYTVGTVPDEYYVRNMTYFRFFFKTYGTPLDIFIGHLNLFNPATGATRILNDFSPADPGSSNWTQDRATATLVPDSLMPSGYAIHFTGPAKAASYTVVRPPSPIVLPGVFDFREWPVLRAFVRFGANASLVNSTDAISIGFGPYVLPPGTPGSAPTSMSYADFNAQGLGPGAEHSGVWVPGTHYDAHMLTPRSLPNVTGAAARVVDSDSAGVVAMEGKEATNVAWTRASVLVAEGALVVFDVVTVAQGLTAPDFNIWLVGPSFPLQIESPPVPVGAAALDAGGFNFTGCLTVNSTRATDRLLLWFGAWTVDGAGRATVANVTVGSNRVSMTGRAQPAAAFARLNNNDGHLGAGTTVFASLLLPHGATDDVHKLADTVSANVVASNATIVFGRADGSAGSVSVWIDYAATQSVAFAVRRS